MIIEGKVNIHLFLCLGVFYQIVYIYIIINFMLVAIIFDKNPYNYKLIGIKIALIQWGKSYGALSFLSIFSLSSGHF